MFLLPDSWNDNYEVDVVAYADGRDVTTIRSVYGFTVGLGQDLALLHSKRRLPCSDFPLPHRFHTQPNHSQSAYIPQNIHLLAYNGTPNLEATYAQYPHTPRKTLDAAFVDLHPDYLSYAKAATSTHWSPDAINHRASSHGGASGGGLYNDDGKLIGTFYVIKRANSSGIHSRGATVLDPTDPTKRIVDVTCDNKAVALDGQHASVFLRSVVAPRLSPAVTAVWRAM
jgi:hypothetical protein